MRRSLPFILGSLTIVGGLCSTPLVTLGEIRLQLTEGAIATPVDLWNSEGAPRLLGSLVALFLGAIIVCSSRPGWLSTLLLLPLGIVNCLIRPVFTMNFPLLLKLAYLGVGAAICWGAGLLLVAPQHFEQLLKLREEYVPAGLGSEVDWQLYVTNYGELASLLILALGWGTMNATLFSLLRKGEVVDLNSAAEDDLSNYLLSRSYSGAGAHVQAASDSVVIQQKKARKLPRALKATRAYWQQELGALGFETAESWEFIDDAGQAGHTLMMLGCTNLVMVELSSFCEQDRVTLTSLLEDGRVVRTIQASDDRPDDDDPNELVVAAPEDQEPKALLATHLATVSDFAEVGQTKLVSATAEYLAERLCHGGFAAVGSLSLKPASAPGKPELSVISAGER